MNIGSMNETLIMSEEKLKRTKKGDIPAETHPMVRMESGTIIKKTMSLAFPFLFAPGIPEFGVVTVYRFSTLRFIRTTA